MTYKGKIEAHLKDKLEKKKRISSILYTHILLYIMAR